MAPADTKGTCRRRVLCQQCAEFDIRALFVAFLRAPSGSRKHWAPTHSSQHRRRQWDGVFRFYRLKPNLIALKSSATSCDFCSAIYHQMIKLREGVELTDDELSSQLSNEPIFLNIDNWEHSRTRAPHLIAAQYSADWSNDVPCGRRLASFDVCSSPGKEPDDRQFSDILGRVQASDSGNESCVDLAKGWLQECSESHSRCRPSRSLTLPTRVLDVAKETCMVRLIDGSQHSGRYVGLSYCWGGERNLCFDSATNEMLRKGISDNILPAMLRDAVSMTRSLGFRYLWIDALCIQQDSPDDWAKEAAQMSEIYHGAIVTLEIASAAKPSEGFLKPRTNSKPYVELEWRLESSHVAAVQLRPFHDISDIQLTDSTIFLRGWTMQERVLAPRTISFGEQQISFECAEGYEDEARRAALLSCSTEYHLLKKSMYQIRRGQSAYFTTISRVGRLLGLPAYIDTPLRQLIFQGDLRISRYDYSSYYDYWRMMVERFSERQFTYLTDRLPALSGLAKQIQRATGDTYCAGHWYSDLLWSLSWSTLHTYNADGAWADGDTRSNSNAFTSNWPHDIQIRQFVAPSWSWASVKTRIEWMKLRKHDPLASIIGTKTMPTFTDPLGGIDAAYLDIKGPTLRIPNIMHPCDEEYSYSSLHAKLRLSYVHFNSDQASEFFQHHRLHDGQQFALLKLSPPQEGPPARDYFSAYC